MTPEEKQLRIDLGLWTVWDASEDKVTQDINREIDKLFLHELGTMIYDQSLRERKTAPQRTRPVRNKRHHRGNTQ
jgi:hypothetical protein